MSWSKKEILLLLGISLIFLVLRVPGLHNLYHQDEYKWPIIVNPALTEPGGIPHPPVGEFIYRELGALVGYDNFRTIPLIFSFINLFLLFYLAKMVGDRRNAFWSVFFFAISFYSVLASLMVDTDGAIMPTFLLVAFIGYYKLRETNFQFSLRDFQKSKWFMLMILGLVLGFFVKASFVIGIGALGLDFAFEKKIFSDRRKILRYFFFALGGAIALVLLLLFAKLLFPFFKLEASVKYWEHFFRFADRGWLQTFIQFAKSIMYLSPLLLLPALFLDRQMISKYRPFIFFILLGLVFYLLIFDFSSGALDRYFQYLILPATVIVGAVFGKYFNSDSGELNKADIFSVSVISLAVFSLQFFGHFVPSLYPKTEWLSRIFSLKWNFLFPFTGGSGPSGFYVSFLFIALLWICSAVFVVSALKIKEAKRKAIFCLLVLGILYNGVFVEEYLWGKINGSPYHLFDGVKTYLSEHKDIKNVVVYNDIGGYEVQQMGKYARRLYATPQFEESYKQYFQNFSGHILYIDIPKIEAQSFYAKYFSFCQTIYSARDREISAKIFYCKPPRK